MKPDSITTRNLLASFRDNCFDLEDNLTTQAYLWSENHGDNVANDLLEVRQTIRNSRHRIEQFLDSPVHRVVLGKH